MTDLESCEGRKHSAAGHDVVPGVVQHVVDDEVCDVLHASTQLLATLGQ